jgi:streptogramin lyase
MKRSRKALPILLWLLLAAPASAAPVIEEFAPLPTAGSQPQDLVLGPDGNIWFTERGNNKIGRINAADPSQLDEFPTVGTAPDIITVGPEGALWYTELNSNSIGRILPGAAPSAVSFGGLGLQSPRGIAVGPDGNLWVTDAGAPTEVVIVSPAGVKLDDVALPTNFDPRNIAKGPDGNMWVAGFNSNNFARITTAGTPALDPADGYPAPSGVTPMDIIAGSDGNLWYTAQGTTVGRITPAGVATNFTSKGVDPFGITLGPDGAVWYAEFQAGAVGRVDAAGNTSNVTGMTAPAGPRYVTAGPGNTVWFTEETGNRLGRVTGIELPQQPQPQPQPEPQPQPDVTRPDVTGFRITRRVFRVGGLGTVIRWRQSEDARVTIRFDRRVAGRWRRVRRKLSFQSTAGAHRLRFRGRFELKHPLRPGRYRMTLTAKDAAGNVSTPDRTRFRLLPRTRPRR